MVIKTRRRKHCGRLLLTSRSVPAYDSCTPLSSSKYHSSRPRIMDKQICCLRPLLHSTPLLQYKPPYSPLHNPSNTLPLRLPNKPILLLRNPPISPHTLKKLSTLSFPTSKLPRPHARTSSFISKQKFATSFLSHSPPSSWLAAPKSIKVIFGFVGGVEEQGEG